MFKQDTRWLAPIVRAANTYSCDFNFKICARTTRAIGTQPVNDNAIAIGKIPGSKYNINRMITTIFGIEYMTSNNTLHDHIHSTTKVTRNSSKCNPNHHIKKSSNKGD